MGGSSHSHPLPSHDDLGVVVTGDGGHFHRKKILDPFPAHVKNQILVEKTYGSFFDRLATAASQGMIVAELGGGKNGHSPDSPYFSIDHSYSTTTQHLKRGDFCATAIDRIVLCIHITVSDTVREQRAQKRKDIDWDVAKILAIDDFDKSLGLLLQEKRIPVITMSNDQTMSDVEIENLLTKKVLSQIKSVNPPDNKEPPMKKVLQPMC